MAAGFAELGAVPAQWIDGLSRHVHRYLRAVHCTAAAWLIERYRSFDATAAGDRKAEAEKHIGGRSAPRRALGNQRHRRRAAHHRGADLMRVRAIQGDTIDAICQRVYGRTASVTEAVLAANPGIADLGPILPHGTELVLPDISPQQQAVQTVQLWD